MDFEAQWSEAVTVYWLDRPKYSGKQKNAKTVSYFQMSVGFLLIRYDTILLQLLV